MSSEFSDRIKWKIYFFALKVGISSLLKRHATIGLKQLLYPVGYWRFPVFPIVCKIIGNKNKKRKKVLDVGSPKLLSLYLALKLKHTVYATDLQDKEIFDRYQKHYDDFVFSKRESKYIPQFQDARSLKYSDECFDSVYSISVIEHISGNGDKDAMREIARVLRPHGKAVIEVPFAINEKMAYVNENVYERRYEDKPVFFQRYYDEKTLLSRLINPSEMKLLKKIITIERFPFERYWDRLPSTVKIPLLWLEAFVSYANHYFLVYDITSPRKLPKNRAMSATLILEKNKKIIYSKR